MILEKKYIFETVGTKRKRRFFSFLFFCLFITVLYTVASIFLILLSRNENKLTDQSLFQRPPDLIVVFTGDSGRIPYAVEKAKEFKQSNIFITGVYQKNSVKTLIRPLEMDGTINPDQLEIDYLARNTVENVLATLRHLKQHPSERVLVISHDYHLLRMKMIFNTLKDENFPSKLYFSGVRSDLSEMRSYKIIYKEVFKIIRTAMFLALWETDSPTSWVEPKLESR